MKEQITLMLSGDAEKDKSLIDRKLSEGWLVAPGGKGNNLLIMEKEKIEESRRQQLLD